MQTLESGKPAERHRLSGIDALRGLAALAVVLYHYIFYFDVLYGPAKRAAPMLDTAMVPQKYFGLLPVFLFFIISGFVIRMTLDNCRTVDDFAVSRFSRLYPAFLVALFLTFTAGVLAPLPDQHHTLPMLLGNLTMTPGLLGIDAIDGVYWSLQVELYFYLMMGGLFALGQMRRMQAVTLAWASIALATHLFALVPIDIPWKIQAVMVLPYAPFFIAGIALYEVWRKRIQWQGVAAITIAGGDLFTLHPFAVALLGLSFFGLFGVALRVKSGRFLGWLGAISYSLYLLHQMLGYRLMMWAMEAGLTRDSAILLALALALIGASIVTYAIERPALRSIRRFRHSFIDRIAAVPDIRAGIDG